MMRSLHMFKEVRNTFVTTILLWFLIVPSAIAQSLFAAIGDYGDGFATEGMVSGLVSGWSPDFIITLGDNRYGATNFDETVGQFYCNFLADAETGNWCAGGNSLSNAFFPSLGNHDYNDGSGLNEYLNYFTLPGSDVATSGTSGSERYYDFIRGSVHFFVIDSEGALNSSSDKTAQMNWLQAQLAASSAPWKVVYFHHPPYSSAQHGSTTGMQWPFGAWGADAVISGHDHTYERILADGIVYFVNGLGGSDIYGFKHKTVPGSQVRYNSDYGAMRVDASDTAITFEFIDLSGTTIDTYTVSNSTANTALTASFSYACQGKVCQFTDRSFFDPDFGDSITAWSWDFGDGVSSNIPDPSHTYASQGSYTVVLEVTDASVTDTVSTRFRVKNRGSVSGGTDGGGDTGGTIEAERGKKKCTDGLDNDGDGFVDADDPDCNK